MLNPQAQKLLNEHYGSVHTGPPSVAAARERTLSLTKWQAAAEPVASVVETEVPGSHPVPLRLYYPEGSGPHPALVFFHGGGWATGSINTHDRIARRLANSTGRVIVSVEYRLAPEHRFPQPLADCTAAVRWVHKTAEELNLDSKHIGVIGDSAGGNLAAAVSLQQQHKPSFKLDIQILIYPVLDHAFDTDSYDRYATGYLTERKGMQWYWNTYLGAISDGQNPLASPLKAANLQGLPSTIIYTAEYDPLRTEAELFERRLSSAGVPVQKRQYAGLPHAFLMMDGMISDVEQLYADLALDICVRTA